MRKIMDNRGYIYSGVALVAGIASGYLVATTLVSLLGPVGIVVAMGTCGAYLGWKMGA